MKKLIVMFAAVVFATVASADVLYWMVTEDKYNSGEDVNVYAVYTGQPPAGPHLVGTATASQVADASVTFSHSEIHGDCLGVTDMKISVWLWRETSLDTTSILPFGKILHDHLLYKTQTFLLFVCFYFFNIHSNLPLVLFVKCKGNDFY